MVHLGARRGGRIELARTHSAARPPCRPQRSALAACAGRPPPAGWCDSQRATGRGIEAKGSNRAAIIRAGSAYGCPARGGAEWGVDSLAYLAGAGHAAVGGAPLRAAPSRGRSEIRCRTKMGLRAAAGSLHMHAQRSGCVGRGGGRHERHGGAAGRGRAGGRGAAGCGRGRGGGQRAGELLNLARQRALSVEQDGTAPLVLVQQRGVLEVLHQRSLALRGGGGEEEKGCSVGWLVVGMGGHSWAAVEARQTGAALASGAANEGWKAQTSTAPGQVEAARPVRLRP